MAKDKKALERKRQAKAMRQKTRARERRRVQSSERPPDDYELFRDDLLPDDVPASIWNRLQILQDLDGRTPTQALAEFFDLFVDVERLCEGDPEARSQMEWGLFLWRLALVEPEERAEIIRKSGEELPAPPEGQPTFEEFATAMVEAHEEMFPRLHEHIARVRAAARREAGEEGGGPSPETADAAYLEGLARAMGLAQFVEYASVLVEPTAGDRKRGREAMNLAYFFYRLGELPLDERAALLSERRESLPPAKRDEFDATARMMLRRYREMFAEEPTEEPEHAPPAAVAPSAQPVETTEAETEESSTEGERKTSPLARLFRRR